MLNSVTVMQMKAIEKNAVNLGASYLDLMDNAGMACVFEIVRNHYLINKSFVILSGSGNNGGDGFVIAQKLYEKGANITVVLCGGTPKTTESQITFSRLNNNEVEILNITDDFYAASAAVAECDFIIDCIYGTGFSGKIEGAVKNIIEKANFSKSINISIDIPSGINADTGVCDETFFKANYTYILGVAKTAHVMPQLRELFGQSAVLDIGIPEDAFKLVSTQAVDITYELIQDILPKRKNDCNKGDFGKLLNISGSVGMGGAALMSTLAALKCGVGLLCLATPKTVAYNMFPAVMEAITMPLAMTGDGQIHSEATSDILLKLRNYSACLIGCGLGVSNHTKYVVRNILNYSKIPLIIDADGINCIYDDIDIIKNAKATVILTPHPGEMSRLTGYSIDFIQQNRVKVAQDFSAQFNVILVLKGSETIVALPSGEVYKNTTGNPGMAKAGSGDVLAGMLASFVAQGISFDKAAILAVFAHGLAGDIAAEKLSQTAMLPRDIISELPLLFKKLDN